MTGKHVHPGPASLNPVVIDDSYREKKRVPTTEPQQHCDHECVCARYQASHSDYEDEDTEACTFSCMQRSRPVLSSESNVYGYDDVMKYFKGFVPALEAHEATIRNQTLEELIIYFRNINVKGSRMVTLSDVIEELKSRKGGS